MSSFAGRIFVASAVFLGTVVVLLLIYVLRVPAAVIFASLTFASAVRPIARLVQRRLGLSVGWSTLLVYVLLALIAVAIFYLVVPTLITELVALAEAAPAFVGRVGEWLATAAARFGISPSALGLGQGLSALTSVGLPALGQILAFSISLIGVVAWLLTGLALSLYWLVQRDEALLRIGGLLALGRRRPFYETWILVENKLGAYILGQVLVSLIIAFLAFIGLFVLGVPFPLVLAIFAGLAEWIPILGPYLSAVPALLVALTQSPTLALFTAIWFFIIQVAEGNLIYPKIQERVIRVPAFWILLSLIIGTDLLGLLGALIAVPVAVLVSVLFDVLLPRPESGATTDTTANRADGGGRRP